MPDGMSGGWRSPSRQGAISAPSLYCLTFLPGREGRLKSALMKGRLASGTFSTSAGSVANLNSTSGIRISGIRETPVRWSPSPIDRRRDQGGNARSRRWRRQPDRGPAALHVCRRGLPTVAGAVAAKTGVEQHDLAAGPDGGDRKMGCSILVGTDAGRGQRLLDLIEGRRSSP